MFIKQSIFFILDYKAKINMSNIKKLKIIKFNNKYIISKMFLLIISIIFLIWLLYNDYKRAIEFHKRFTMQKN